MGKRLKAITWLLTGILACALLFAPAPKSEAFTFWLWGEGRENFLEYTETDPNGRYTVTANKIDVSGLTRDEDAYVYKDYGAGYFSGTVSTHYFECYIDSSSTNSGQAITWMLANTIEDSGDIVTGSHPAIYAFLQTSGGTPYIVLGESSGGSQYSDADAISFDTQYWATAVRDKSAGSFGTVYLYVYSDSDRSVLEVSLSVALHETTNYRYIYGANSNDQNQAAQTFTGWMQNLDIIQ
jgi:hypothetical protein